MFWTVTERIMPSDSIETTDYFGSMETNTYPSWRTIKSDVVPTVSPSSSYTVTSTYSDYAVVKEYYSTGAVADSDLLPDSTGLYAATDASATPTITSIEFSMPVVMTAPASCPTAFTVSTTVEVTVPSEVWGAIKPVSTISATSSTGIYYAYDYQTWLLSASAAPFTSTEDFTYSYYIASCSTPPAHYTGSGGYGGNTNDNTSGDRSWRDYEACYFGGCTSVMTWIIIIATILPGLFLLGFLESYLWFRRLMMGKSAMRFGTICWVFLSLWVLCFTRMQDARSTDDQKLLTEKWRATPTGQALKLWLRWGFKHRYPVPVLGQFSKQTVGIVPEGEALHPALPQGAAPAQMGQVYYYPSAQQPTGSYPVPSPEHAGYYGAPAAPAPTGMSKGVPAVATSPVSPIQPPAQTYHAPSSSPPTAQLPTPPQAPADASRADGTQPPRAPHAQ
jgi:hypothetical protein